MLTSDKSIFMDLNGFASLHTINGVEKTVIKGDEINGHSELDNSWVQMFDVTIWKDDITKPAKGQKMTFDGTSYTVDAWKDDGEAYVITLSTARVGETMS